MISLFRLSQTCKQLSRQLTAGNGLVFVEFFFLKLSFSDIGTSNTKGNPFEKV